MHWVAWGSQGQAATPGSKGSVLQCWGASVPPVSAHIYSRHTPNALYVPGGGSVGYLSIHPISTLRVVLGPSEFSRWED